MEILIYCTGMLRVRLLRLVLPLIATSLASATSLVVPNSFAASSGNDPGNAPSDLRVQIVYGSGQFGAFGGKTSPITGLYFRVAANTGALEWDLPLQITASTTQAFPNTQSDHTLPSITFASNTGSDATVVFNSQLVASAAGCSGSAPCPFNIYVPFATSFNYNPNAGRLLLDFVFGANTSSGFLDAVSFADFTSSTVAAVAGSPSSATGTLDPGGPIIQLIYTPEPATFATVLLAGIALMKTGKRKNA